MTMQQLQALMASFPTVEREGEHIARTFSVGANGVVLNHYDVKDSSGKRIGHGAAIHHVVGGQVEDSFWYGASGSSPALPSVRRANQSTSALECAEACEADVHCLAYHFGSDFERTSAGNELSHSAHTCQLFTSLKAKRGRAGASAVTSEHYLPNPGGYPSGPKNVKAGEAWLNSAEDFFPTLLFVYFGAWAVCMALYTYRKRSSEEGLLDEGSRFAGEDYVLVAYSDTGLGLACYKVYKSFTPVIALLYLLILIDTYWDCQLRGPDNLCFKGNHPLLGSGKYPDKTGPTVNQNVFFVWWCMGVCWVFWNFFFGSYMANFFRVRCTFAHASHVLCMRENKQHVMSKTNSFVLWSRRMSEEMGSGVSYFEVTAEVKSDGQIKYFDFMCTQYIYDEACKAFAAAEFSVPASYQLLRQSAGLTSAEQASRLSLLGPNAIPYRVNSWLELAAEEFSSYLYVYQFTFFSVWLWFSALVWGSPQVFVVLICAWLSIVIKRHNQEKIQELTMMFTQCTVQRNGQWVVVDSQELVPGDLVKLVQGNWVLPCDLVITRGTCICDESGLTGESMPVRKSEVPGTAGAYDVEHDQKHTLFAGTKLLQAGSDADEEVTAVVTETGIRTVKGELVSAILFPASMVFEYDEELRVVFGFLSIYAMALFGISVWLQTKISPLTWVSVFAFAAFTVSQILPPLLPVALVIGHTMSAERLKKKQILCVDPKRIAISGKIHAFMFDKTGTLTKQGLEFLGCHRCRAASSTQALSPQQQSLAPAAGAPGTVQFETSKAAYSAELAEPQDMLTWALATCHAVTTLNHPGSAERAELVGNQVEVQMFRGCGWELEELHGQAPRVTSPVTRETLTIAKRFEFDHHTMTMSVVVRDMHGHVHAFCKGAPERVGALCTAASLPHDFDETARRHAMDGCYVIALSHAYLGAISDAQVGQLLRAQVEGAGKLDFLGLMLFRNELKPDTKQARHSDCHSLLPVTPFSALTRKACALRATLRAQSACTGRAFTARSPLTAGHRHDQAG